MYQSDWGNLSFRHESWLSPVLSLWISSTLCGAVRLYMINPKKQLYAHFRKQCKCCIIFGRCMLNYASSVYKWLSTLYLIILQLENVFAKRPQGWKKCVTRLVNKKQADRRYEFDGASSFPSTLSVTWNFCSSISCRLEECSNKNEFLQTASPLEFFLHVNVCVIVQLKTTMTVMKANKSYKLVVHKKGFGGSGENILNT